MFHNNIPIVNMSKFSDTISKCLMNETEIITVASQHGKYDAQKKDINVLEANATNDKGRRSRRNHGSRDARKETSRGVLGQLLGKRGDSFGDQG